MLLDIFFTGWIAHDWQLSRPQSLIFHGAQLFSEFAADTLTIILTTPTLKLPLATASEQDMFKIWLKSVEFEGIKNSLKERRTFYQNITSSIRAFNIWCISYYVLCSEEIINSSPEPFEKVAVFIYILTLMCPFSFHF